jgi:hypothetical protein
VAFALKSSKSLKATQIIARGEAAGENPGYVHHKHPTLKGSHKSLDLYDPFRVGMVYGSSSRGCIRFTHSTPGYYPGHLRRPFLMKMRSIFYISIAFI